MSAKIKVANQGPIYLDSVVQTLDTPTCKAFEVRTIQKYPDIRCTCPYINLEDEEHILSSGISLWLRATDRTLNLDPEANLLEDTEVSIEGIDFGADLDSDADRWEVMTTPTSFGLDIVLVRWDNDTSEFLYERPVSSLIVAKEPDAILGVEHGSDLECRMLYEYS